MRSDAVTTSHEPFNGRRHAEYQGIYPPPANLKRTRPTPASQGEYLSFRVGEEEYALDILRVQEIRSYEPPTRMAGAGEAIKGVVNLRGTIVPVVDLRVVLSVDAPRFDDFTVVVVLNVLHRVVGVVVDSVSDVVALSADQVCPAPGLSGGAHSEFILGIASLPRASTADSDTDDRMLIVANIETLLAAPGIGLHDGGDQFLT